MATAKRRHPRRVTLLEQPLVRWLTDADRMMRFEHSYLDRVSTYADRVADLTASRSLDPGEWITDYAGFVSRVIGDLGDWMHDREPRREQGEEVLLFLRARLRKSEGTTAIRLRLPALAFEGVRGRDPQVTLVTQGFLPYRGGTGIPANRVQFVPAKVKRSKPTTELKVFDVRHAVIPDTVYGGVVCAKESGRMVAAVEIEVQ